MLHLCIRISMHCTMADILQQILIPIMDLYYRFLIQSIFIVESVEFLAIFNYFMGLFSVPVFYGYCKLIDLNEG